MLRLAALLALVLGFGGFGGYLTLLGKTPFASEELRHLRLMKDRAGVPASYTPMTVAEFEALPRYAPLAEYSGLERRGASIEGYVQRMLRSSDGDVHFEIVERIPEAYKEPYMTCEVAATNTAGGRWSWSDLEWGLRPWRSPEMDPWNQPPRRVRMSGWLLHDYQYELGPVQPGSREPRVSAWEIHPVTAIEVWDESASRWEPLAP
jgi:hypothetical protein